MLLFVADRLTFATPSVLLHNLKILLFLIVSEPKVPFKRKLQDVEVQEKLSATLMCEVPVSATQASWFMEETRLEQNNKYRMEQEGTLRRLTIHNVTTNDDGVYICEMKEGSRTVAELTVLGMVKTFFLFLFLVKYYVKHYSAVISMVLCYYQE